VKCGKLNFDIFKEKKERESVLEIETVVESGKGQI
jgi:hypothetical protein